MDKDEALKLAFEYITQSGFQTGINEVVAAIKQALEQPEQKDEKGIPRTFWGGLEQPEPEPVAYDGTATENGARYQANQHLRALLRYTENFYIVAIEHGMKAGETANAIAHIEKAAKALHELVHAWAGVAETRPPKRKPLTDERTAFEAYCKTLHPLWNASTSRTQAEEFFHAGWQAAQGIKEKNT